MSQVPRPDSFPSPDHPLLMAARYSDSMGEEVGIEQQVADMGLTILDLIHVARQRAIRAVLAQDGDIDTMNEIGKSNQARTIKFSPEQHKRVDDLTPVYLEGFILGWKAKEIADRT